MLLLLLFLAATSLIGVGLMLKMYRVGEPLFGVAGLLVLIGSAGAASVYGMLASI
jgi:hypothetical protein